MDRGWLSGKGRYLQKVLELVSALTAPWLRCLSLGQTA